MDNNGNSKKGAEKKEEGKKAAWKQWGVLAAIVAIIALGGYFLGNGTAKAPSEAEGDAAALGATEENAESERYAFSWEFAPAGGDGTTGAPFTKVTLVAGGTAKELGTFTGSCSIIGVTDTWALQPNEVTGTLCSWDGDGVELGVFLENGAYVLKKGALTEGAEGEGSVRGDYEVLETL